MPAFLRITTTNRVRLINVDQLVDVDYQPLAGPRYRGDDHNPPWPELTLTGPGPEGYLLTLTGPEATAAAATLGLVIATPGLHREGTDLLYLERDHPETRCGDWSPIRREPAPAPAIISGLTKDDPEDELIYDADDPQEIDVPEYGPHAGAVVREPVDDDDCPF